MIEEKIDKYLKEETYSKNEFKEIFRTFLKKEHFPSQYIDDMINILFFIEKNGNMKDICPVLSKKISMYIKEHVETQKI